MQYSHVRPLDFYSKHIMLSLILFRSDKILPLQVLLPLAGGPLEIPPTAAELKPPHIDINNLFVLTGALARIDPPQVKAYC